MTDDAPRPVREPGAARVVGVDIGGTKVAAALVDVDGRVLDRELVETPGRTVAAQVVEDVIVTVVERLRERAGGLDAVGIGAAGLVSDGVVAFSPHLSWRHEPLRDTLGARLRVPVVVDNDANAALWAEHRFGVARGVSSVVMVNLGTGIGGGLVLDGRLVRGASGLAGEFGHMQVVPGGQRCECGNRGCWEQYASGRVLVREAQEMIAADSPAVAGLAARVAQSDAGLTGPLITQAAREGDATCRELLADVGGWLGMGIANLVAAFDPELVVVGGGVSQAGDLLLEPARAAVGRHLLGRGHRVAPPVVAASLLGEAGVVGAADLARASLREG